MECTCIRGARPKRLGLAALARAGRWAEALAALDAGMDPDERGPLGDTAMFWACAEDRDDVVESLLLSAASVESVGESRLAGLAPGGRVNALEVAVLAGSARACRALLRENAAPARALRLGLTPLHWASLADTPQSRACVEALLDAGWWPGKAPGHAEGPLSLAIALGRGEVAAALLLGGASPAERDAVGRSPFDHARFRCDGPRWALLQAFEAHPEYEAAEKAAMRSRERPPGAAGDAEAGPKSQPGRDIAGAPIVSRRLPEGAWLARDGEDEPDAADPRFALGYSMPLTRLM